ncbi:extracellular protein precursor [Lactobacillus selangorensis]|uniref:Extracellular protein n=1 Tax=Lactobacillus selangorensis TaxID=81857 RepID=A0A0R2FFU4_9LACO|nr:DUF948 domain-containing protein [Lactobacillus selangorensis]KRN27471.1 extracellular protein precursor [Lactobacillus selangorensis]KRN31332.1 extracellular protein precursor [Lactobacillus selangorensis]
MTGGQIAGLIAAIAFLILVLALVMAIRRVTKIMKEVQGTVQEANRTVTVVTNDVDVLSKQVEGLLEKSNVLLNDLNGKVSDLDPVFKAAGDLGQSVSDVNDASHHLVNRINDVGKTTAKAGVASRVGLSALRFYNKHRKDDDSTDQQS